MEKFSNTNTTDTYKTKDTNKIDIFSKIILDIDNSYKIDKYEICFEKLYFIKTVLDIKDCEVSYSKSNAEKINKGSPNKTNKSSDDDLELNLKKNSIKFSKENLNSSNIKTLLDLNNFVNKEYNDILYNKKNLIFNIQEDFNLISTCLDIHKYITSTKPEREHKGVSTWYLYDDKVNTVTMCCKCTVKTSILHLLSVFAELDLMKDFINKFDKIEKIGDFSIFRWILDIKIRLPSILSNRDTIAYGIGKVLPEENSVLITFKSVDNALKEYCNLIIPENTSNVKYKRIDVNFGYHYIKIINEEECELYFCGNVNPKVSLVPMFIINKVMKELAFYLMDAFRKQFESTKHLDIYKERRQKNKQFYGMISEELKILNKK